MKIELKNLQHVERLSEETHCFTATLYLNGVKRGEVSNRGTGGGDDFTDHTARREIDDYAITLPAKEYQGIMLRMNAEILIGELVEAHLQTQYEKKLCRNKTAFTIPGDEPGSFRTISRPYTPESKAWILSNHPTAVILNEKYV